MTQTNFRPEVLDLQEGVRKFMEERNAKIQALMAQVDEEIALIHDAGLMIEKHFPVGVNEPMKNFWIKAKIEINSL